MPGETLTDTIIPAINQPTDTGQHKGDGADENGFSESRTSLFGTHATERNGQGLSPRVDNFQRECDDELSYDECSGSTRPRKTEESQNSSFEEYDKLRSGGGRGGTSQSSPERLRGFSHGGDSQEDSKLRPRLRHTTRILVGELHGRPNSDAKSDIGFVRDSIGSKRTNDYVNRLSTVGDGVNFRMDTKFFKNSSTRKRSWP